jgi:hypothetical protein
MHQEIQQPRLSHRRARWQIHSAINARPACEMRARL